MEEGESIGRWRVIRPLGKGGMGSVYLCRNAHVDDMLAAVKVLSDPGVEQRERFRREAVVLCKLNHPNIVRIRDIDLDHSPPFLVMDVAEGESLGASIKGTRSLRERLVLCHALAEAMVYVHASGARHRDLKPANIRVRTDGTPVLLDFGIALHAAQGDRLTTHRLSPATYEYAPPEVLGRTVDEVLWDIYSLGVVFAEIFTGRVAYRVEGTGPFALHVLQLIMRKEQDGSLKISGVPEPISSLVSDMTQSDPDERIADMGQVRDRLVAALTLAPAAVPLDVAEASTVPTPPSGLEFEPKLPKSTPEPLPEVSLAPPPPSRPGVVRTGVALAILGPATAAVVAVMLVKSPDPSTTPDPSSPDQAAVPAPSASLSADHTMDGAAGPVPLAAPPAPVPVGPDAPSTSSEPRPTAVAAPRPVQPAPLPSDEPAPAPPPEPASVPQEAPGLPPRVDLVVNVHPSGSAELDGRPLDRVPWVGSAPVGPHRVTFIAADGARADLPFVLYGGTATCRLCWNFERGSQCDPARSSTDPCGRPR